MKFDAENPASMRRSSKKQFSRQTANLDNIAYVFYLLNVGLRNIHFVLSFRERNKANILNFTMELTPGFQRQVKKAFQ